PWRAPRGPPPLPPLPRLRLAVRRPPPGRRRGLERPLDGRRRGRPRPLGPAAGRLGPDGAGPARGVRQRRPHPRGTGPADEAALGRWDRLLAPSARTGRFLPAVGGSDAHAPEDRVGLPQNVVLADGLERGAVLQALAAGGCWLAASAAVDLDLEATAAGRPAGIGGRLEALPDREVTVRLRVRGAAGCLAR